jgi:hypothetical protein
MRKANIAAAVSICFFAAAGPALAQTYEQLIAGAIKDGRQTKFFWPGKQALLSKSCLKNKPKNGSPTSSILASLKPAS